MMKKILVEKMVRFCDECGVCEDDLVGVAMEQCLQCGADVCVTHSNFYSGGTCVYVCEGGECVGVYCSKCSVGKVSKSKYE